jgi:uncharacterized protein (TIGR03118 family)
VRLTWNGLCSGLRIVPVACVGAALAACGGGYGGGGGAMATAPTINLAVQPSAITVGQSATLTWSTGSATSCSASGAWSGTESTGGNLQVTPTAAGNVTYTLTCAGMSASSYGGGASSSAKSVTLTVNVATAFVAKNLVADTASGTVTVDTNLVNPWGIAFGPGPAWVANNHTETSTLYDGTGAPQPAGSPLIVNLPAGTGGAPFDPTGIVFNATADFVVSSGSKSAAALFIYAGEGGMLAGWSHNVDASNAVVMYTDGAGAVYKGLALANIGAGNFLYATDFHNNKVDVFNATFTKQPSNATSFTFKDPALPAGYAPFGIQALKSGAGATVQIYVAYAKQQAPDNHDNANGAGLGLIDIYDANGMLLKRLVMAGGALNAPWGMALAPADFGTLSNVLLVGNFGDGKINGYDPNNGQFMGTLSTANGAFLAPGLWGIAFGNDAASQPHNSLFFAAGPNDEANGSYGRIDLP